MLKPDGELEASTVVANNTMNRERGLSGVNSYHRALGLDPYELLRVRLDRRGRASWLDLCCGEGNALIEAAGRFGDRGVEIVGVDLVGRLAPGAIPPGLRLVTESLATWNPKPGQRFDLVTCVHGLHYIGDKLDLLTRAARWPAADGVFVADFDPASVRHADASPATRLVTRALRRAGAGYDSRAHRLTFHGALDLSFPAEYLGADDAAGASYTGQPAVAAHYRWRVGGTA